MQCRRILFVPVKVSEIWCHSFDIPSVTLRKFSQSRNPYDVLGLKKSCTTQDVKKAYIKLCKEFHPDAKPGDASQHKKFVELNNAYTTLVNSDSRKKFDQKSEEAPHKVHQEKYKKAHGPFDQGHWQKEEAWYEREDYKEYYQRKNSPRLRTHLSNKIVVLGCFILVIIGSVMYFSAYSFATRYTISRVDEKSRIISEKYQDARKKALDIGKEERVEKLKRRWNV